MYICRYRYIYIVSMKGSWVFFWRCLIKFFRVLFPVVAFLWNSSEILCTLGARSSLKYENLNDGSFQNFFALKICYPLFV